MKSVKRTNFKRKKSTRRTFTPKQAREIVMVSYRMLQYWDTTGLIKPSDSAPDEFRRYTVDDLIFMDVLKLLRPSAKPRVRGEHKPKKALEFSIQQLRTLLPDIDATLRSRPKGDSVRDYTVLVAKDFNSDDPLVVVGKNLRLKPDHFKKFFIWNAQSLFDRITGEELPKAA